MITDWPTTHATVNNKTPAIWRTWVCLSLNEAPNIPVLYHNVVGYFAVSALKISVKSDLSSFLTNEIIGTKISSWPN